jgi:tungstate transport system ATP-binding protein
MTALLHVEGLNKRFAERVILDDAVLLLQPGVRYVLTGDNGAGKTTLLKILAGLEQADAARFEYAGSAFDLARYPATLRRDIVYVHQHPYLFHTTVMGNIGYGLVSRHVPQGEKERRIRLAMAWANLDHLRDVPPNKLSGGEKQRVAIARGKVLEPRVMLLDEPTANLDADSRRQIVYLLEELSRAETCVLIASHDQEIVGLPGTTHLHLRDGRLSLLNGLPAAPAEAVLPG